MRKVYLILRTPKPRNNRNFIRKYATPHNKQKVQNGTTHFREFNEQLILIKFPNQKDEYLFQYSVFLEKSSLPATCMCTMIKRHKHKFSCMNMSQTTVKEYYGNPVIKSNVEGGVCGPL